MIYFGLRADDIADEDLFEAAHGTAANYNGPGVRGVIYIASRFTINNLQLAAREGIEPSTK